MKYEQELTVRYTEIEKDGKLGLPGLLKLLQEIGCLHTDKVKVGINNIIETNLVWIVLQWKVEMYKTAKWNEKLQVKTWARGTSNQLYCYRDYLVYNKKNEIVAKATSKWVLMNSQTGKITKISQEMDKQFEPEGIKVFEGEIEKLKEPEKYHTVYPYKVLRRDIDTNQHVNNINYLYIAYEALPEEIYEKEEFNKLEIMYKHSCLLGDNTICHYTKEEEKHIVTIKTGEKLNAIIILS